MTKNDRREVEYRNHIREIAEAEAAEREQLFLEETREAEAAEAAKREQAYIELQRELEDEEFQEWLAEKIEQRQLFLAAKELVVDPDSDTWDRVEGIRNLGVIWDSAPPTRMLIDDWLVKEQLHWIGAQAAVGKTWIGLWFTKQLLDEGKRVLYFDEELGETVFIERLKALGVEKDKVEDNLIYWQWPSFGTEPDDERLHKAVIAHTCPDLVVYDTATDFFTNMRLDENNGVDVTTWVKMYPEQARRLGATPIVFDHLPKSKDNVSLIGSRAKRAKAKVVYLLESVKKFSPETQGLITVTLDKNTLGAPLPEDARAFEIGGTPFVFQGATAPEVADRLIKYLEERDAVIEAIQKCDEAPSQKQLWDLCGFSKPKGTRILTALVSDGTLTTSPGPRRSILYSVSAAASLIQSVS